MVFMRSLFFLLLLGCALSGCQKKEKVERPEQVFRMNCHSEPGSIDPGLMRDIPTVTVGKMLFEGLTRMTEKGPIPACADKITVSPDGLLYVFHLRPCFWSDGSIVTADDFVYAWRRVLSPSF